MGRPTVASGDSAEEIAKRFVTPPDGARPGVFWCWLNGNMTRERITADLEAMKSKGLMRTVIYDLAAVNRPDIVPAGPAFLGEESAALIRFALEEGRRLGIKIGLVASSGWNAGGSWVMPDWAAKGLYFSETQVVGGKKIVLELTFPRVPDGCPKNADGTPIYSREVAVIAVPYNADKTLDNIGQVVVLTQHCKDGVLEWNAPAGNWNIFRFVCSNTGQKLIVPSPNSNGLFIDFLAPDATRKHLHYIINCLGVTEANQTLESLFFDSMELADGIAWTEEMPAVFKEMQGYDIEKYLPALAGWKINDVQDKFMYDFRKTISDRLIFSHYTTGSAYLRKYGVKLEAEAGGPGPPIWNTCPVDALKALGNVDIACGEFWIKHRNMFLIKEISSATHIYGKELVDAESFTTWRRWKDSPYDIKKLVDRAFCEGLNSLLILSFQSSPPEAGKPGWTYHAGYDFGPTVTWWDKALPFSDYLARCCYMLRQGKFVADVCYYYGDQAPNFFPVYHNVVEKPRIKGLDAGYDFDVINTDVIMSRLTVRNGRLTLPDGMSYAVMVLPEEAVIPPVVVSKLKALIKDGAQIIGSNKYLQVENTTADAFLAKHGIGKDFDFQGNTSLDYIHRSTNVGEVYFIRNESDSVYASGTACFRIEGRTPEFWDASTGERFSAAGDYTTADGFTKLPLALAPHGSVFVVFTDSAATPLQSTPLLRGAKLIDIQALTVENSYEITPPWHVSFDPEWGGAKEPVVFNKLQSWTDFAEPHIKYYSGTAVYKNDINCPFSIVNSQLYLDLGEVRDVAEVFINGKSAGVLWKKPFIANISGLLKEGANELKIEVTNLWVNRLTGDSFLHPDSRYCHTNHPFVTHEVWQGGDEPYREQPSGLLGTVQLIAVPNYNVEVQNLTCEYAERPLGVDSETPMLGWRLSSDKQGVMQVAYRILVASSAEKLARDNGDLWDSGMTASGKSQQVKYAGKPLQSAQYCYWKVKIRDNDGRETAWSEPSHWCTGIYNPEKWRGKWISCRADTVTASRGFLDSWKPDEDWQEKDTAAVYMRKNVGIKNEIVRATAFVCGLGYYELYINGAKVGDRVMDPAFSDYQRTVYYATHDVTAFLHKGTNALGVILGNGFYNLPGRDLFQTEKARWKTAPKLLLNIVLEYASGKREVIATDCSWRWNDGEITYNSIRGGETIDHTRRRDGWNTAAFDDRNWHKTVEAPAPVGVLTSQLLPPMRVCDTFKPQNITEPKPGVFLVDFGENMTGYIELNTQGAKGQTVVCDYNEILNQDGTLNTGHSHSHTGGRFQQERFILAGDNVKERFEPRFTYHGFRYVQISGLSQKTDVKDITAKSVHSDLPVTATFSSSDEKYNQLFAACKRTQLNSVHGMISEEPTREKMGWTLDAGDGAPTYLFYFDAVNAVRKNIQDFIDAQEPSGHIPAIVPTGGWSYTYPDGKPFLWDDPWWGGSIFLLVENLFEYTGDTSVIAHSFDVMNQYVDFLTVTARDDTVNWSLGDWLDAAHKSFTPGLTPVVQTSTAGYYWMTYLVSRYASMLNKNDVAEKYAANAQRIRQNFNKYFLDPQTGWYSYDSQTAQVLPLYLGIVPDEMKAKVEARLLDAIKSHDGHISAGFIGQNPLLEYLCDHGFTDVAYRMVSKREKSGWMYMVKSDKSTMGENLHSESVGSGHHPYGADIGFWLIKYLAGIMPDPQQPGFQHFIIRPYFPDDMTNLSVEMQSPYGQIRTSWQRTPNGKIRYKVSIPCNTTARISLPGIEIKDYHSGIYEFEI
ncbi:MAG: family 78 glycoside hydrolase catalytic domain [Tannerella sp.]|nr:family 78 glycoside hydrolase catalytic domain [Tannerella sp.]